MSDHLLSSYDYDLPTAQIAQNPAEPRDSSRLLVVDSPTSHHHCHFHDLPQWLQRGDLLILNNTQVIPARLYGETESGAEIEILLIEEQSPCRWLCLVKPGKRFKLGNQIYFPARSHPSPLTASVCDHDNATGGRILQFTCPTHCSFWKLIEKYGQIPFPPYVTQSTAIASQYQTIYANRPGAVAAPTAGLHFTESLFTTLAQHGIKTAYITLHVGIGTFRPVEVADITHHQMHQEWIELPQQTVNQILATKARGGRVIAIGTTSVRSIESAFHKSLDQGFKQLQPFQGKTDLFIYPGYQWQIIDGLITNFHLPKSSLLMMISALLGRKRLLQLYQEAIAQSYRFYSFGDAMLILPSAWQHELTSN
jgi:S-adenosylmethionine:tRNA ribosyltransferase-isomerase